MVKGNDNFKHPQYLVTVEWLFDNLQDTNLRIYDCTAHLLPHPTKTYTVGSGRDDYNKAHIPGADFLDLQNAFYDAFFSATGRGRANIQPRDNYQALIQ